MVKYTDIMSNSLRVKDYLNSNKIKLIFKSIPLCIHNNYNEYAYEINELNEMDSVKRGDDGSLIWQTRAKHRIKLKSCDNCLAYNKYCF
ncbi:MAG: hypothetical protein ACOZBL_02165 [Patescibacteria group bacterium]